MKMYIPEIGEEIRLVSEWKFYLHPEFRNQALGMANNHYLGGKGWIDANTLSPMREHDFDVKYPDQKEYSGAFFCQKLVRKIHRRLPKSRKRLP